MILTVSDSANSYLQFMTVLIMFVFVLAITYFTTKWIAGYQQSKGAGANLEVIESRLLRLLIISMFRLFVLGRNIWQLQSERILLQC